MSPCDQRLRMGSAALRTGLSRLLVLSLTLGMCACATLNEAECLAADWRLIGLEDGSQGLPLAQLGAHRKACAKHGVTPDLESYQQGHRQGALVFCGSPANGFAKGRAGATGYETFCPQAVAGQFLAAYAHGRQVYQAEQVLTDARRALQVVREELEQLHEHKNTHTAAVVAEDTSPQERRQLLAELEDLQFRVLELQELLADHELAVALARQDLEQLLVDAAY